MQKHPDADSFVREYLTRPAEATTRLVFADWLEETGDPSNVAWANFIRLRDEANRHELDSRERDELLTHAADWAVEIHARLTISAKVFVSHPEALLQLLPAANITVRLENFEIPRDKLYYMPESVARENVLFPLDVRDRTFLIATADPYNIDTRQKLEFILNRDIVLVCAEPDDIAAAITREYGQYETQSVDSVLVAFADTPTPFELPRFFVDATSDVGDAPVVRLVNLIFTEAINLRADRILFYPDLDALAVRYRIDHEWVERDRIPARLLRPVTTRVAVMGVIDADRIFEHPDLAQPSTGMFDIGVNGQQLRFRVTILPSPDGPTTQIDIIRHRS